MTICYSSQGKQRLLLRQYDSKNKQLSWRQGLSHLLRRSKSGTSGTSTNNNVAVLRNKQSNGTTGNSVSKKPPGDRDAYYKEMDARWTAPPSPAHQCSKYSVVLLS